eukprot:COSAG01_NODE_7084_length_3361_cov_1.822195_6_plen_60_part_00
MIQTPNIYAAIGTQVSDGHGLTHIHQAGSRAAAAASWPPAGGRVGGGPDHGLRADPCGA